MGAISFPTVAHLSTSVAGDGALCGGVVQPTAHVQYCTGVCVRVRVKLTQVQ